ncbi:UNVERIFIED_CONTAM: hypothetical protein GTU68_023242 [Idotea baltica]|nr:hypothetical protein [Idotea baltica]
MYQDYFLDYASYVILERAVPALYDGLKPVQRRFLHAMRQKDDGRYHKLANIIGNTMQYHPHGDTSIGSALVNMGQKGLLIDPQGNWGDVRTGDSAAAARYIEARLTKFALEVAFNPQTTDWQLSYDGRNKEPINLPMKFPLLLAHGGEGIAVGLSTKIMPHNFNEIIRASIQWLKGRKQKIYPDFLTGGMVDVSNYNAGKRGGKIRVRAKIVEVNKMTLAIKDLPFGVTTSSLVDSILKANDKGKIKIKKVLDNTAQDVEVLVELAPGTSPTVMIDALYAFTSCEVSISTNACVIYENKPEFLDVDEILRRSTDQTKALLGLELSIKKNELLEKLYFSSLEKIFIEERIYREIEESETWEDVIRTIDEELKKYVATPGTKTAKDKRLYLYRDVTEEDIVRLTEIKIKRISKYNKFKAEELLQSLADELKEVQHHIDNLTDYAIAYFENLLNKYGKNKERRTIIKEFDDIVVKDVVVNNSKLYINYKEGFVGNGIKNDDGSEFVVDCSDLDDVIAFTQDGKFKVTRISKKTFIGKGIIYANIWKKGDNRTTYSMIYRDGTSGKSYAKRFQIKSITRDKDYDLTKGNSGSKVHYFNAHPNGEAEIVTVQLSQTAKARKKVFQYGFEDFGIKGRGAGGVILTKYAIRKVTIDEIGTSSFGALELYVDDISGKLNTEERGKRLGKFDTGDHILVVYKNGDFGHFEMDMNRRFEMDKIAYMDKFDSKMIGNLVYYDGHKRWSILKRFNFEMGRVNERYSLLTDHSSSQFLLFTLHSDALIEYKEKRKNNVEEYEFRPEDIMDVKGWKAIGNKLSDEKIYNVHISEMPAPKKPSAKLKAGESIDLDIKKGQGDLFGKS